MSLYEPSVFISVGDQDYPSTIHSHIDMTIDSRLRAARKNYSASWRSVIGAGLREATSTRLYAELFVYNIQAIDACFFGMCKEGTEVTTSATFLGGTDTVSYRSSNGPGGEIRYNAAIVQTGLTTYTTGDYVGLEFYSNAGTPTVQFYKNGVAVGTPVALTSGNWRIAASGYPIGWETAFNLDFDDQRYRPSTSQPWATAARVADAGGYSPAASTFDSASKHANVTLDAYSKTAICSTSGPNARGNAGITIGSTNLRGLVYVEFLLEVIPSPLVGPVIGLMTTSHSNNNYVGSSSSSWGYLGSTGNRYTNAVATATGVTWTTAGDRPGFLLDPVTGNLWFTLAGSPVGGGDPEAGTGAHYSGITGTLYPAVSAYIGSRLRLCTHASEQLYRPSYAEAWDGADLLPERHYAGRIGADTEITESLWFSFPWGGGKSKSSPIGNIDIINGDGKYDPLLDYNLRDQSLKIYEWYDNNYVSQIAYALIDSISFDNERRTRILTRGIDAKLDVRAVSGTVFAIGGGGEGFFPVTISNATDLVYDVSSNLYWSGAVFDQGLASLKYDATTGWMYANSNNAYGFRRVTNPAGAHRVRSFVSYRYTGLLSTPNTNFSAWTADNPDNWGAVEAGGPNSLITQNSGCQFIRNAGAGICSIQKNVATGSSQAKLFFKITVSAYSSGDLEINSAGGLYRRAGINGTGVFYVQDESVGGGAHNVIVRAIDTTNLTITSLEFVLVESHGTSEDIVRALLVDYAGLSASQYSLTANDIPSSEAVCTYWSNRGPLVREVLQFYISPYLVDFYTRNDGVLRFEKLQDPSGMSSSVALREEDLTGAITVKDDRAPDLTSVFYNYPNWDPYEESELATTVTAALRRVLLREGLKISVPTSYHAFYAHANNANPIKTPHNHPTTNTGATRAATCWGDKRNFLEAETYINKVRNLRPGQAFTLTHSRHGMSAGRQWYLYERTRSIISKKVKIKGWS